MIKIVEMAFSFKNFEPKLYGKKCLSFQTMNHLVAYSSYPMITVGACYIFIQLTDACGTLCAKHCARHRACRQDHDIHFALKGK